MSGILRQLLGWPGWRASAAQWQINMLEGWARYWPVFVLGAGLLLYFPYLGLRPLRFEEGRRALQVLEMLEGGAWWHLKFIGTPYVNKPPFTPWLMAAVGLLRGVLDEVTVRLPGVIAALAGALSAGTAALVLAPRDQKVAALTAGLAFLCSVQILLKARIGETDVTVTALCGMALALWLYGRARQHFGPALWLGIAALLACAAMTKGPIPVAFSALPMILMPLLERKPREALVAVAIIAVAHLPMLAWAWSNRPDAGAAHWVSEMRLGGEVGGDNRLTRLLHLSDLPLAVLYQLPFLPAAVALVFARADLPRERRWVIDALLLAAVPLGVLTTILPIGRTRYSMPATWPLAVMAGLWVSMNWRRLYMAHFIIGAGLTIAVIVQLVQIVVTDGRTSGQRQLRADVEAFSAVMRSLPPGPMPVVWDHDHMNENILVYGHRKIFELRRDELDCQVASGYLVAGASDIAVMDASPNWTKIEPLSDWGALYRRVEEAPTRNCKPRFAPA
ncbi:ArnT family glycosyltransferase [Mesorhizobium amorphae]|uniref:ArnT family glycosyltransferase n=1 Tax=Mesorhizobium amorphae TaxID=71433 RepID=UPI001186ED68|nr:glycosyltransferase family 39 protein [Mesorhizobium amorphae]